MRHTLWWCSTIVAVFQLQLSAAEPSTTRVPVSPSVSALASRVELDAPRERARFAAEIIRRVYAPPTSRQVLLDLVPTEPPAATALLVDVPLTPDLWSRAIFNRPVTSERLLATILADRRAALLCRGLLGADDDTLAFYAAHAALLTFIYERAPGAFAAFAGSIRVRDGQLVVPGGEPARLLWATAVPARTSDPEAFIRALLFEPEARPAYVYDVLATASPASRAFALGLWLDDPSLRARRFQALLAEARTSFREWHVEELPFGRPLNDLALLLLRIRTAPDGAPAPPADRRFWGTVFDAEPLPAGPGEPVAATHTRIDAAWLLRATAGDMYARGDRLDQLAFGQRVFGAIAGTEFEPAASVLHDMTTRRMLLLGLERMGISTPDVYAAGLRQARLAGTGAADRFWTLAQLQGAFAVVARMERAGTLEPRAAEALMRSLFALPLQAGALRGALADWYRSALAPHLPTGESWQARSVAGVAGGPTPGDPIVDWEGERYRVDLAGAERRRIEAIQSRQGGPDLDAAFAVVALARKAMRVTTSAAARDAADEARQLVSTAGALLARPPVTGMAAGVPLPRDGREWLTRTADELERAARVNDLRRANRAGETLLPLGDIALGQALLSLVYAIHLGDPDGPALLGANVSLRHDFGFGRRDGENRSRGPWALPRQDFQPGVPWHVAGSLVGLDIALAPLALRRLSMDSLANPPTLQSIEREAFAVNVALLDPRALRDLDRDRIVDAIGQGRIRVRALGATPAEFETLENEVTLDGWRLRTLRWVMQNERASIENQFSLGELAMLGGLEPAAFDAWGANSLLSDGCLCTHFPMPRTWRVLAGRTQLAMMAASTVEMNLELAQRFAALRLPAVLLPSVLATAMQDFVDTVDTADANDLAALSPHVRALGRNAVDDYVAATAANGPLVPVNAAVFEP